MFKEFSTALGQITFLSLQVIFKWGSREDYYKTGDRLYQTKTKKRNRSKTRITTAYPLITHSSKKPSYPTLITLFKPYFLVAKKVVTLVNCY